jgi:hypothetical protein
MKQDLHTKFLAILPRIELHARIYFRHLRCHHQKHNYMAKMASSPRTSLEWEPSPAAPSKGAYPCPTASRPS